MLLLPLLVAQSSALALQPVRRGAAAVRSARAAMMSRDDPPIVFSSGIQSDEDDDAAAAAAAEAHAKMLAHLKAPIRQFEGGWGDTSLRDGGKSKDRFGKGPTPHLGEPEGRSGSQTGTLPPDKQAQLVLPEESWKVTKMEVSQTDEDFVMECALDENQEAEMFIDIEPMFLTQTEYFYGFTSDSDPKLSIDPDMSSDIQGVMEPKGHKVKGGAMTKEEMLKRVSIKLKFKPESAVGEFIAFLCFIFPDDKAFSKFYKITGKSTSGVSDS